MKKNSQPRLPQINCTSSYWCPLAKYKPVQQLPDTIGHYHLLVVTYTTPLHRGPATQSKQKAGGGGWNMTTDAWKLELLRQHQLS
jgi:hypothetical protein